MTHEKLTRRHVIALTGGTAATALAGCLGGDTDSAGDDADEQTDVVAERDAYVVTYHWGYAVFDEHGDELDLLEVEPNTEVTIHAVNDHASDAFESLPDPVAAQLEDFDALGRTKQHVEEGEIPEPDEGIEEVYNEAHGGGHGHDDGGHDDDGHDDHDDDGHDDDGHDDHDDDGHDDHDDDGHDDDGHDGHDDDGHDDDGHDDHDDAMLEHGLMIEEFDVLIEAPGDMHDPATATFVAEEPGTYQASCTVPCGYGHTRQQTDLVHVTEEA